MSQTSKKTTMKTGKTVGAALHTTKLMEYAVRRTQPWRVTDAVRELNINTSTCFNLVQTLVGLKWLQRAEHLTPGKYYTTGSAFRKLAYHISTHNNVDRTVQRQLQEIAAKWQVTTTLLHQLSVSGMELRAIATSPAAINIQMPPGQRLPVLLGGMGRVMASMGDLSPFTVKELFERVRWGRPLSFEKFMEQVDAASQLGWGMDDGYMNPHVCVVSVPVRHRKLTAVEYVISATMFRNQYTNKQLDELASVMKTAATELSELIYSVRDTE